jgi:hypothetical protein
MSKHKKLIGLLLLFSIIYIILVLTIPWDIGTLTKYGVTLFQAKLIITTYILPYIAVWFIALYGYIQIKEYLGRIKGWREFAPLSFVSKGLFGLMLWLPISTLLAVLEDHVKYDYPEWLPAMVRTERYTNLLLLFFSIFLIYTGSRGLLRLIKYRRRTIMQYIALVIALLLAGLYAYLTMRVTGHQIVRNGVVEDAYHLPDWLLFSTLIVPRLVTWIIGVLAVQNLFIYRRAVQGRLYNTILSRLTIGIGIVILSIIGLRYTESLTYQLQSLALGLYLSVAFGFLIGIGTGFVFIAKGAQHLLQIEEI